MNSKKFLAFAMAAAHDPVHDRLRRLRLRRGVQRHDSTAGTAFKLGGTGPSPEGPPSTAWPPSGARRSPWTRLTPRVAPSSST